MRILLNPKAFPIRFEMGEALLFARAVTKEEGI